MINDEGNDDADNNSTPSASSELPRYRGPVKLEWVDGPDSLYIPDFESRQQMEHLASYKNLIL